MVLDHVFMKIIVYSVHHGRPSPTLRSCFLYWQNHWVPLLGASASGHAWSEHTQLLPGSINIFFHYRSRQVRHSVFKMAADLEIFKCLYLFSFTSYGLITGLADFFTERCYWYLQHALNHYLKAAPLWSKSLISPIFLLFYLSFYFHLSSSSQAIPVLLEPLELLFHSSSALGLKMYNDRVKRRKKTFSAYESHCCDSAWLCGLTPFPLLLTSYAWIH